MVAETFPHALRLVLVDEGGLDDDPHDHGGRTAHGIIQREYDGFRSRHNLPLQSVWKITPAEYTEIYHDRYWMPWCDRLPAGMDYAFFDACVNAGPNQAAKTLQRALGVRIDGFMGDVTLAAVYEHCDTEEGAEAIIAAFCEARRSFYRALAQFPRYGRGWLARVDHVEKAAKVMAVAGAHATERAPLPSELQQQATARAKAEHVQLPPISTEAGAAATTGAAAGGGLADQLAHASSQFAPFQDAIHMVKYIMLGIAVVSVVLTLYSVWYAQKIKEATG
jgi:lysozyme family protein